MDCHRLATLKIALHLANGGPLVSGSLDFAKLNLQFVIFIDLLFKMSLERKNKSTRLALFTQKQFSILSYRYGTTKSKKFLNDAISLPGVDTSSNKCPSLRQLKASHTITNQFKRIMQCHFQVDQSKKQEKGWKTIIKKVRSCIFKKLYINTQIEHFCKGASRDAKYYQFKEKPNLE